jgi:hypothetical protein
MRAFLIGTTLLAAVSALAAESVETQGTLDAVTVYRGQARVTRLVEVAGPAGLREVVVTNLPEHLMPGSLFAEPVEGVEVRSVRYRVRPVAGDMRENVRRLDAEIAEVRDRLDANQRYTRLAGADKAYLGKLEQFTAVTADVERSRGILDAATLQELSTYIFDQRKRLMERELELAREQNGLNRQLDLLQRRRSELTGGSARTAREAVVFVDQQAQRGGSFRLHYLVDQATWSPSYNLRADEARDAVHVEYNASIRQMSGEDWGSVTVTLSTATPTLAAKAPTLTPLTVNLVTRNVPQSSAAAGKGYAAAQQQLRQQKQQAEHSRNFQSILALNRALEQGQVQCAAPAWSDFIAADSHLNDLAGRMQVVDLVHHTATRPGGPNGGPGESRVSVTYQLVGRNTFPSRSDQQLIQIASFRLPARFYKIATPVLTPFIYEEASMTNDGNVVLLAGPVSAFVSGEFVGRGQLPTVAVGEPFTFGFGVDSSLRATRSLVRRTEKIQGGNRIIDFTYRLAVENFGDAATTVRLQDRLPTGPESQLKVTLDDSCATVLSDDPAYRRDARKKGILRWDLDIAAREADAPSVAIEYQFRLEFDKELTIAEPPAATG